MYSMDRDQIIGYLEANVKRHKGQAKRRDDRRLCRQIRERKKFGVVANLSLSRYDLVRRTVKEAGFTIKDDEDMSDAFLVWTDNFLPLERIMSLKSHQRLNHFPGMIEICRKDFLAKNFIKMNRIEPVEYSFMPKTWVLPQEHGFFLNYARRAVDRGLKLTFILKPANGAMGHGIRLYRNAESVPANPMGGTPCVVQEYINNPLLIDGFKCDLRVYVLVTSCDPLRVYVYNDGLVRLGTEKYMDPSASNGESVYMHLTNYAVNKRHAGYNRSPNEMVGSKRSFSFLDHYLRDTRHVDPVHIWRSIRELIVKTIAIAAPHLLHSYRMCSRGHVQLGRAFSLEAIPAHGFPESRFVASQEVRRSNLRKTNMRSTGERLTKTSTESASTLASTGSVRSQRARSQSSAKTRGIAHFIPSHFFEILGFDILLDNDLKPWLLEVNRSPSFNGDQELDRRVKHGLLMDTLRLLNIRPSDKEAAEKEQHLTACRRLYTNGSASTNQKLFQSTAVRRSDRLEPSTYRSPSMNRIQAMGVAQRLPNTDVSGLSPYAVEQMIIRLRQQLLLIRQRLALEFFEYHNCGNWNLLFPTEDPVAQQRFARFILKNFAKFHNGKAGELQKEMEVTYLNPITEDEILVRLNELFRRYSGNSSPFDIDQNHFDFWSKDQDNYQTEPDQSSSEESLSSNSEQQISTTNTHEAPNTGFENADKRKDTMKSVLHTEKTHCISNKTEELSKPTLTNVHSIIGTQGLVRMNHCALRRSAAYELWKY
ncbi:Tubulin polyglutamylase TTLL7 [Fasciola hepatica]|uniref:Tubulin polyglutamylase TTLL7 n=1 Tax=Fasciola hepatica TaxID=6192 RepID=A0A4E0REL0_FASHE|nr:Tubulin polyglutamylase TTLL7 [Fasciola hepatica]